MNEWYDENGEPRTPPKLCIDDWGKNSELYDTIKDLLGFEFFVGVWVGILLGLLIMT